MHSFNSGAPNAEPNNLQFVQPCAPWNLETMPWKLATTSTPQPGGVMTFGPIVETDAATTSAAAAFESASPSTSKWLQKRKSEEQWALPPKQFITEERITAHFSGLHISGDYKHQHQQQHLQQHNQHQQYGSSTMIQGGLPSDDTPSTSSGKTDSYIGGGNPAYQLAAQELEQKLRNANRIVLCDAVKPLDDIRQKCNVIPEILLKNMPRPCTALIPWQPPPIDAKLLCHNAIDGSKSVAGKEAMDDGEVVLEDYVDIDDYYDNNNTCNINLNKADDLMMDEDL